MEQIGLFTIACLVLIFVQCGLISWILLKFIDRFFEKAKGVEITKTKD
jgi:hypothetical protein